MPFLEKLSKDYKHLKKKKKYKNAGVDKVMIVFPHYPSSGSLLWKMAHHYKVSITNRLVDNPDYCMFWEYATVREEFKPLENYLPNVINFNSRDIGKVSVDHAFKDVFGYGTEIDPKVYVGKGVIKSDINALHDGKIVDFPINETYQDCIYQILIDNTYGENLVLDYRVPIINGQIPFIYLKYRDISERFKNTTVETKLVEVDEYLSKVEQLKIVEFAKEVSLDYGELDVLRDNTSKKIYVVDVNNTPQGPPANTPKEQGEEAIRRAGELFFNEFAR